MKHEVLMCQLDNDISNMADVIEESIPYEYQSELESCIENIRFTYDELYSNLEKEEDFEGHYDDELKENEILKEILSEKLTYEDKTYYRIKYGVDIF